MIRAYAMKARVGIGAGLLLSFGLLARFGLTMSPSGTGWSPSAALAVTMAGLLARALFIWGCLMYARAKGRSGGWGALGLLIAFGPLCLIALVVLLLLRDHAKDGRPPARGDVESVLIPEPIEPPAPQA